MQKKSIFVLYTGGTIGMRQSPHGLTPDTALAECALTPYADRYHFHWHLVDPLIDSSAVTLNNWQEWLTIVHKALAQHDGVLILHGTDTLAYTANLMALAISTNKPIILTGAQWPFNAPDSDAPDNLDCAVAAFDLPMLSQPVIAFNGKLYPAIGSSKVSTETANGFANLHFGHIAERHQQHWQTVDTLPESRQFPADTAPLHANIQVACYTLIPGMMATHIGQQLAHSTAQAVILQSYGHGNAPADAELIRGAETFCRRGGLLLNISQVPQGCAAAVYAQGNALRQAGVISGGKCNLETATVLLTLAASKGYTTQQVDGWLKQLQLV